ncbi:non-heme iron oxygenase ferredoxin subunit [Nocardioides sp. GXZ039]|uniref:non-heme iron oxygenase ferredoxin subunit n=1 Tax=Nocardioides sp. GXZ039 TaxID=3136018 RepID=UPI0030F3A339
MTDHRVWVPVLASTDLVEGGVRQSAAVTPPVAVYRYEGAVFATDDTCTHAESSLSEGYFEDGEIECLLHMARFCVRTGRAMCLPATQALGVYPAREADGVIEVLVAPESVSVETGAQP